MDGLVGAEQRVRVVLFDLDDTLYPEMEYVRSGFRAVSRAFATPTTPEQLLLSWMSDVFATDRGHVFDRVSERMAALGAGLGQEDLGQAGERGGAGAQELSTRMIECYRDHTPDIHLCPDAAWCLSLLMAEGVPMGLITDGIATVQEKKVQALGLDGVMDLILYTDRLAPGRKHWKPSPRAFAMAASHFGVMPSQCCYVADNPGKDFDGPASLGMPTVWVQRPGGIYAAGATGAADTLGTAGAAPSDGGAAPTGHALPTLRLQDLHGLPELLGFGRRVSDGNGPATPEYGDHQY